MPSSLFNNPSFKTTEEGLLLFNGLVYISSGLRAEIVIKNHEEPMAGHQGIGKTLERISRIYYFPDIRKYVEKEIAEYIIYNRNKLSKHVFYK